jgi:bifunctional DNA primase/polymerase-like protein
MAGIFATWQPEYAARGLATFPYTASSADRRQPLVGNYTRMGLPASRQIALKFPDADGLALMAGARSKITVIDIDARGAEADRLLADAMRRYGQASFITRTGRDGRHAYYRNSGEPRKIRPDPSTPIDLLGGGPVVLPPSKGSQFAYEIIHGTIDDLASLTPIRRDSGTPIAGNFDALVSAQVGERDAKFWPYIKRFANQAASYDALLEHAREINEMMTVPLPDYDVVAKCKHWWKKTERGENRWGIGQFTTVDHSLIDKLMLTDPDGFTLLMFLRRTHWGREFVLANETRQLMPLNGSKIGQSGWKRERFAAARTRLIEAGYLVIVRPARFNPNRPMSLRLGR